MISRATTTRQVPRHHDRDRPNLPEGRGGTEQGRNAVKFLMNATDEELLTEGRRLEAATRRHPVPPHVIGSRVHQCTSALRAIRASLRKLKAADPSSPLFTEQQVAQMVDRSTPRDRESDEAAKILRMTVNHMHEPVRRELVPAARVGRSPVFSSKDEERIAVHRNETRPGFTPSPNPRKKK